MDVEVCVVAEALAHTHTRGDGRKESRLSNMIRIVAAYGPPAW